MDIEPMTMGDRKTFELIQKNEHRLSNRSTDHVNRSTIFEFFYFWSIFFLSASFFADIMIYFWFYQEKNNELSYKDTPFYLRIIIDALFVSPLLIFIRYALTDDTKNYLIGIVVFLPQFVLSIISIISINNQDFVTEDDIKNINITEFSFLYNSNIAYGNEATKLTDRRVTILKISPVINLFFYLLTIVLTYLKIYKNF